MTEMQTVEVDSSNSDDVEVEDRINGGMAGQEFAHRHIIGKMNIFMEEYRRNGFSEEFIAGYVEGINEVTGGNIGLDAGDSDEELQELLDNPPDSD